MTINVNNLDLQSCYHLDIQIIEYILIYNISKKKNKPKNPNNHLTNIKILVLSPNVINEFNAN